MAENSRETIYTATKRVSCDGAKGALGHPRIWLEMGDDERVECPYCSRLYILKNAESPGADNSGNTGVSPAISPNT